MIRVLIFAVRTVTQPFVNIHPELKRDRLDTIKSDLRKIIRSTQLQALNKLLQSEGKSIMEEPKAEDTYQKTKMAYESFNTKVIAYGDNVFEASTRCCP